jgi:hypothetical protein
VGIVNQLRTWRPLWTGQGDTPFDGDFQAWVVSLAFHLVLLMSIGVISMAPRRDQITLTLVASPVSDPEPELAEEFYFVPEPLEEIGAGSLHGTEMAIAAAPSVAEISAIPRSEAEPFAAGTILFHEAVNAATGPNANKNHLVRGRAGVAVTGASGAIDRITHEILLSLEERKTLVVWLFDQSRSLARQRDVIRSRFDRIYEELGIIESSGSLAFKKHGQQPLLTSVVAFGDIATFRLQKPTADVESIKAAVAGIEVDDSGVENVFSAVSQAAQRFKPLRRIQPHTRQPERNVMLVVVIDEAGDDQQYLDDTVDLCRRLEMPVYVIGVPAPFGRRETLVKWVDPDPRYDQTPEWAEVSQGPESLRPEGVKIHFVGSREETAAIDSGFGSFALTRLCYETGGIYFAVHPNRNLNGPIRRHETAEYAAYFEHFFDPDVMRKYRPDYVSAAEYDRQLKENRARQALVNAAEMSWIIPLESPPVRFVKRDEASLAAALTEAQKAAAKLEPAIRSLYETIKVGQGDRADETTPRWMAGYDLAMGRILAVLTRTESYNAMLAQAKRGMPFHHEKNNTWVLRPANTISVGSRLAQQAEQAQTYLRRVVDEHPQTPWALLAKRELAHPLGWKWTEDSTDLDPPRPAQASANPQPPQDDQRRMLPPPKPKRPVPRL